MTDRPLTPDPLATLLTQHRFQFPPHADGLYISSALCSCGEWQYDDVSDRDAVEESWAEHFAARLLAAGVTLTQPQPDAGLREALEWIAAKADGFCPECEGGVLIDPEDGTPEPCFDSIHVISAKAKVALRSTPAASLRVIDVDAWMPQHASYCASRSEDEECVCGVGDEYVRMLETARSTPDTPQPPQPQPDAEFDHDEERDERGVFCCVEHAAMHLDAQPEPDPRGTALPVPLEWRSQPQPDAGLREAARERLYALPEGWRETMTVGDIVDAVLGPRDESNRKGKQ